MCKNNLKMNRNSLILILSFIIFSSLTIQTEPHETYKLYDASSEFTSRKTLRLFKDKSYTYYYWSHTGYGTICDSGSWKTIATVLILQSIKTVLNTEDCRKLTRKEKKLPQSEIYKLTHENMDLYFSNDTFYLKKDKLYKFEESKLKVKFYDITE